MPLSFGVWVQELKEYLDLKAEEKKIVDPIEIESYYLRRYQDYLASFDQ